MPSVVNQKQAHDHKNMIGHLNQPQGKYEIVERKEYYLRQHKNSYYFYDDFLDGQLIGFRGCFPKEWFLDVEEVGQYMEKREEALQLPPEHCEQLNLF